VINGIFLGEFNNTKFAILSTILTSFYFRGFLLPLFSVPVSIVSKSNFFFFFSFHQLPESNSNTYFPSPLETALPILKVWHRLRKLQKFAYIANFGH
jgi:hypothetical protein